MKIKSLKIFTLLAYIAMVAINYLAVLLPIGGRSTGEISDAYPNLFAPAGYAFSIWGLIYLLLGIYVIYQFKQKDDNLVDQVNRIFIINALLNATWIFAWHYDLIWLSLIIMLGLLITLIKIADIFIKNKPNIKQTWLMRLPFSLYFGWITVATIANVTVFLAYLGWNGFGVAESFWTIAVLIIGALIGIWRMWGDRFFPYGLVLIWAYTGILVKHLSVSGFDSQYIGVIVTVIICLLAFVGTTILISIKKQ